MFRFSKTVALLLISCVPAFCGPPIAHFQTVLGSFDVVLDPSAAPTSVTNFATYANRGAYASTIIHRSTTYDPTKIQIVQGGGFQLIANSLEAVPADPPISLEAGLPNSRGTIAMARTSDRDSATTQWYFNVRNNPGLDFNYAVFGRVLGTGMSVVDAIAAVTVYNASENLGSTFAELPLLAPLLSISNLVLINSVRVEHFAITNITRSGNATELRWSPLSTNTPVRVERTTDLNGGSWAPVGTNLITGNFTDTNAPSRGAYYRVVAEP